MTESDIAILAQQDMATLARWHNILNSWGWPDELPDPEPKIYIPGGRRGELMKWIFEAVGHRAISHDWNVLWQKHQAFQMTEDEFNDWWRGHFEGHATSLARSNAAMKERVARFEKKS